MKTLDQIIEAVARSNSRVIAIEYARNSGVITDADAINGITQEINDIKEEIQLIKSQFMKDRQLEAEEKT